MGRGSERLDSIQLLIVVFDESLSFFLGGIEHLRCVAKSRCLRAIVRLSQVRIRHLLSAPHHYKVESGLRSGTTVDTRAVFCQNNFDRIVTLITDRKLRAMVATKQIAKTMDRATSDWLNRYGDSCGVTQQRLVE